jgi:hypothetical protein
MLFVGLQLIESIDFLAISMKQCYVEMHLISVSRQDAVFASKQEWRHPRNKFPPYPDGPDHSRMGQSRLEIPYFRVILVWSKDDRFFCL